MAERGKRVSTAGINIEFVTFAGSHNVSRLLIDDVIITGAYGDGGVIFVGEVAPSKCHHH